MLLGQWFRQFICTSDLGGAFSNWSYCVLCVLSDTLGLGCMMFIFCEADLRMLAFVAYFAPWFSEYCTMSFRMYIAQYVTHVTRKER